MTLAFPARRNVAARIRSVKWTSSEAASAQGAAQTELLTAHLGAQPVARSRNTIRAG